MSLCRGALTLTHGHLVVLVVLMLTCPLWCLRTVLRDFRMHVIKLTKCQLLCKSTQDAIESQMKRNIWKEVGMR